jgi:hypothetical protein
LFFRVLLNVIRLFESTYRGPIFLDLVSAAYADAVASLQVPINTRRSNCLSVEKANIGKIKILWDLAKMSGLHSFRVAATRFYRFMVI